MPIMNTPESKRAPLAQVDSPAVDYEVIIGLEVHAQLLTRSKMFCSCSADYASAPPDTHVCPICLGMPGVLPTINRQAIEYTVMTALALNCFISEYTKFDRKNYPYPDLVKGYQISQYNAPIGVGGWIDVEVEGDKRRIGITRVHLEEDTAKLTHRHNSGEEAYTLVDVNRAGVPLMEIVGEPDIRSAEEARQYLIKLRAILQYLGVSTGNMEEGSFRCDANISLRPVGSSQYLPKVEVKNMNSFKAVYLAMKYEVERQRELLQEGKMPVQETRGWVDEKGITVTQRSKEFAHDYRYFPEPDLPPLHLSREWVETIKAKLPELPEARRDRFRQQYGLSLYDASLLTGSKTLADYFEACLQTYQQPKKIANWLLGEFSRLLNVSGTDVIQSKVKPQQLCALLDLSDKGIISGTAAKEIFEEMFHSGKSATQIVAEKGLAQISDAGEVEKAITQAIASSAQAVADYHAGKKQALAYLVGQVMKLTRGRADAKLVTELLRTALDEKE